MKLTTRSIFGAAALLLALPALASHEPVAPSTAYIEKDLPQQFGWRHGVQVSGEAGDQSRADEVVQVAGEWGPLRDLALAYETGVSYEHDSVLMGTAWDINNSLYLTGWLDEKWLLGIGTTLNSHVVDGAISLEQTSFAYDLFAQYQVTKNLSLGGFVSYIYSDINNIDFTLNGVPGSIGGDAHRFGAGLLASWQQQWRVYTFTFTTSLASMNAGTVAEVFDTEYMSWNNLLSVHRPITERLDVTVYAAWIRLLSSPASNQRDTEFGNLGAELGYRLNERWLLSAGYERTFFYSGFENHAGFVGATLSF